MKHWKPSYYNFTTRSVDGTVIIFNALSGQILYFPKEKFVHEISPILEGGKQPSKTDTSVWELLAKGGFIRNTRNETNNIRTNYIHSQYQMDRMALTIVPSQECNFACGYCYEKDKSGRMSDEIAQEVVEFCRRWIYPKTELSLCWYGGEPLLAVDRIKWLSAKIKAVMLEKNGTFNASMITNGYLLTPRIVQTLLKCGVKSVQITIDGDATSHDRFRHLRNGDPTYKRIFKNLVASARSGLFINVRINVGKHNIQETFSVFKELANAGIQERVSISFGYLDDMCNNSPLARKLALPLKQFSQIEYRGHLHQLNYGFKCGWGLEPRPTYCSAVRPSFLLITHDGRINKCWNRAGNTDEFIGHVSEPADLNTVENNFLSWDPLNRGKCRLCKYLPLCMGGCPDQAMRATKKNLCTPLIYSLEKILQLKYMWETVGFGYKG